MMSTVAVQADALVNAITLTGLVFAMMSLPPAGRGSPIDGRLGALYGWLIAFLAARQVQWLFPDRWLVTAIMASAAWLPLVVLLLVEELLRRHAPRHLKWPALSCGLVFTAAAVFSGAVWARPVLIAFAVTLATLLALILVFIVRNRRRDLTLAETRMADSVALALLLCVPLAMTEFRSLLPLSPVALGTPAILLFVVMSAALATGIGSPLRFLFDLAALLCAAVAVTLATYVLAPVLNQGDLMRLGVNVVCVCAAILVLYRLNESRRRGLQRQSIVAALAHLPDSAQEDQLIGAHPVTAAGTIIAADRFALYGPETEQALAPYRVISRATELDADAAGAVRNLLDEHAASHLVRLGRSPLRLLAIASGAIGDDGLVETELAVLSRLAEGSHGC